MHAAREADHLPVRVPDLRVLDQEVPEEAPAQQAREPLAVGQRGEADARVVQLRGRRGRQGPLAHLGVGGGRQVDAPGRGLGVEEAGERGDPQPGGGAQGLQEADEPALPVHQPVGARPDPELLPVVNHRHRAGPAAGLEIPDALRRIRERHEVAQPLVDREDRDRRSLLLGEVVAAQRLRIEAGEREVRVVHQDELHPGLAQDARELRLPDPLGQPHAPRGHPEARLDELGQGLDLPDLVPVRQERQDRLVEAAGQQLHLPIGGEPPQQIEGGPRALLEGREQAPGAVDGQGQAGAGLRDRLQEGVVGPEDRVVDDALEVTDRLVIVDAEEEVERGVTHDPGPGA